MRSFTVLGLAWLVLLAAGAAAGEGDAGMVLVPAGPFIMGDDAGAPAERPRREATLPAFRIDRHEVTNAEYRRFLEWARDHPDATPRHPDQPAGKDHTPRYWRRFRPPLLERTGIAALQPFSEETFRRDDHPVVGVDWFDAWAYARWAGKRLPTEAEWEKAARGADGRRWPWGDEWDFARCNSGGYEWKGERDGHIYSAPARSYPAGASPYGCLNMAGNVAEWVDSEAPPGEGDGAAPRRKVAKGGSSSSYPSSVRPAARAAWEPAFRHFALGLRCAADAGGE